MSAPTIDELIAWVDGLRPARIREVTAIRAILEQHREFKPAVFAEAYIAEYQLKIIRAFVERVEKRKGESGEGRFGYRQRVYAELAAMEKGAR